MYTEIFSRFQETVKNSEEQKMTNSKILNSYRPDLIPLLYMQKFSKVKWTLDRSEKYTKVNEIHGVFSERNGQSFAWSILIFSFILLHPFK